MGRRGGLPQAPDRVCRVKSWPAAFVPQVPGRSPQVRVRDTVTGQLVPAALGSPHRSMCVGSPHDATHLGTRQPTHVSTCSFAPCATVNVRYIQNITDIDDPLLERAERDGIAWEELATREIDLFREDATALAVLPPEEYLGPSSIPTFIEPIEKLLSTGDAYLVPAPDASQPRPTTSARHQPRPEVRLGQPARRGRHARGLCRARRRSGPRQAQPPRRSPVACAPRGEPSWDGGQLGPGRPGWHIECACIACARLGSPSTSKGAARTSSSPAPR